MIGREMALQAKTDKIQQSTCYPVFFTHNSLFWTRPLAAFGILQVEAFLSLTYNRW